MLMNKEKLVARIRQLKVWLAVRRAPGAVRDLWKWELAYREGLLEWAK